MWFGHCIWWYYGGCLHTGINIQPPTAKCGRKEEDMMKLADTVEGMNSADYKKRFIAEYQQLVIRCRGLANMLNKWDKGIELGFVPTCPRSTYNMQISVMTDYIAVLEARAVMEGIELDTSAASCD